MWIRVLGLLQQREHIGRNVQVLPVKLFSYSYIYFEYSLILFILYTCFTLLETILGISDEICYNMKLCE